jgi:HSP20 family protein
MKSLIPWRDSHLLEEARMEFDDVFRRMFGASIESNGNGKKAWNPHIDVCENDKALVVKADIPGVDPKDIDITVDEGVLIIKGEKKGEREDKQKNYQSMERFVGQFYRSISLPPGVDKDKVTANTANGVITITVPKMPGSQPKKVTVKASE